ncbi:MAG: gamma-glutamylcyclotransferase family protein, partial [Terracidiphilus sp.]
RITGTILELPADPRVLRKLDNYEGYNPEAPQASEFVRVKQIVQLSAGGTLECWMYRYNRQPRA